MFSGCSLDFHAAAGPTQGFASTKDYVGKLKTGLKNGLKRELSFRPESDPRFGQIVG